MDVPSRLQLRVIRAFKSTLEDLEERRSCHSLHSLHSMRNSRSQQGNRPISDITYIDEDSMKSPSPNSGKRCGSCNTAVRLVTPIEESSPTTAENAPLVPPGSPQGGPAAAATQQLGQHRPHTHANTQSTKCCHHHHHHLAGTAPSSPLLQPLSPHHFNTIMAQTLHSNMAAHSSTLQPPPQSSPSEIFNLVHETSI